jgi:hypothetical protein
MNEFKEELHSEPVHGRGGLFTSPYFKIFLFFAMIAVTAIYVGNLLFGPNSYSTILYLEEHRDGLRADIERLKEQNAKYQKEYFELKRIGGEK